MNTGLPLALPLGGSRGGARGARASSEEELIGERIRMILETRPGQVPWRPDFGCDLSSLAGQPATNKRVGEARWRIQSALQTWLPDVEIRDVNVRVLPTGTASANLRLPTVPVAETALLSLGMQARLEVHVEVGIPTGIFTLRAPVEI